jgi:hypothetical protein
MSQPPVISHVTPVLVVAEIEPCIAFWARVGFRILAEVPHDGQIGFAMLGNGTATLMYQTAASVAADLDGSAQDIRWLRPGLHQSHLFVAVVDLAAVESALSDVQIVLPRRRTFYGAHETGYQDPAGNVVIFAQFENEAVEDPGL